MRLDCRKGVPNRANCRARVTNLDTGEVIRRCYLADDETGEWGRYLTNEQGEIYPDATGKAPAREEGRARLRIEILTPTDEPPASTWRDRPPLL